MIAKLESKDHFSIELFGGDQHCRPGETNLTRGIERMTDQGVAGVVQARQRPDHDLARQHL